MALTAAEENEVYQILLGRPMEHSGSGRTALKVVRDGRAEVEMQRANHAAQAKALAEAQAAIASLSTRPTKEEYAKVQAIVNDKNAEVERLQKALDIEINNIKTIEVIDPSVKADLTWIKSKLLTLQGMIANLFKMFRR